MTKSLLKLGLSSLLLGGGYYSLLLLFTAPISRI